eukprot:380168_1
MATGNELSRKEFLNALDRIGKVGDYRINTSTSLPLQQLKYNHFVQYIDGWFQLYNKTQRVSIINDLMQYQRVNYGEGQSITLIMDNKAYLAQKKRWIMQLNSNCNSITKHRQFISSLTYFIKNLPQSFTSIYPTPLQFDAYTATFLPSHDALNSLINKLSQISTWTLLKKQSHTFKQIEYFLKYNKNKSLSLRSLLYSPIMSPLSSPDPTINNKKNIQYNFEEFGIPPDKFCIINTRKRKLKKNHSSQAKKKIKLTHDKENLYKKKYKKFKKIAKNLYNEAIIGQKPRWDEIKLVETDNGLMRDSELNILKIRLNSLFDSNGYIVKGTNKWKGKVMIEKCIKGFVELNGEYKTHPMTDINNKCMNVFDVIHKYKIIQHERIPQLNGQFGVMATMDIPKYVCLGQYIGSEIEQISFGKIFDGTNEEYEHNVYAFDQKIDEGELKKIGVIESKWFVIDPKVGKWKNDELLMSFVNDCRQDIGKNKPTKKDNKFFNVEFVGVKVNGWPQTFLVTKRKVRKGEELMTFYGTDFSKAITMKLQNEQQQIARKKRIDSEILKGYKL